MIFHDAAAAFVALINAAIAWAAVLAAAAAFVLCVVAFTLAPVVAPGARAPRRGPDGRETAEHAPQAASIRARKRRCVPAWAHTEPYHYDEAA